MEKENQVQKLFYDWLKKWQGFKKFAPLSYELIGQQPPSLTFAAEPASTRSTKYIGAPYKIIDFLFRIEYKVKGDDTANRADGTRPLNALAEFFDGISDADKAAIPIGEGRIVRGLEIVEMPAKSDQGENSNQTYSASFRLTYEQRK